MQCPQISIKEKKKLGLLKTTTAQWSQEDLVSACDTAAQGPYAIIASSYVICQGLFVILILFGIGPNCQCFACSMKSDNATTICDKEEFINDAYVGEENRKRSSTNLFHHIETYTFYIHFFVNIVNRYRVLVSMNTKSERSSIRTPEIEYINSWDRVTRFQIK